MVNESKVRHLEFIQGVINRMASNSFMLKGWAVTLVSGIFVLAGKETDKLYFLVAYIPIIVFYGLDSYYLLQERLYRKLYCKVRLTQDEKVDFSLSISKMKTKDNLRMYCRCIISPTEFWFYFPLASVCSVIIIITHFSI